MNKINSSKPEAYIKRPLLLSVLGIVILTYSGVLSLIMLALTIENKWVTEVFNDYLPDRNIDNIKLLVVTASGFFIFGLTFWSGLLIWLLRYKGFIIFISITIITIFVLAFSGFGHLPEYISLVVIVLLVFFYSVKVKRMTNSEKGGEAEVEKQMDL